jgi:glycosyltransferase involved in cell wall biosynthesis
VPPAKDSSPERIRLRWLIKGLGPGGAETLLVSLAERLDGDRFEIEVDYLLPWKDHLVGDLEQAGALVRCLGVRHPSDPRWVARFMDRVRQIDIVHLHSPLPAGIIRPLLRAMPGAPAIVSTEHNSWTSFAPVSRALNSLTISMNDATLVVADDVRQSMGRKARHAQTVVHGVDLDRIRAIGSSRDEVRRELGVSSDRLVALTIANLRANKAYPDLLHAAKQVIESNPQIDFLAVGQGPLEAELAALRDGLGLGTRFRFLGHQPDAYRLLAGADVFVLASHVEGLPVAAMEAMAAGLPIVATGVGGLADAVRDGVDGRLVPPARPDRLASAIREVLDDPQRRRAMGRASAERAELFDIDRAVEQHEQLYTSLATPQRRAHPKGDSVARR